MVGAETVPQGVGLVLFPVGKSGSLVERGHLGLKLGDGERAFLDWALFEPCDGVGLQFHYAQAAFLGNGGVNGHNALLQIDIVPRQQMQLVGAMPAKRPSVISASNSP